MPSSTVGAGSKSADNDPSAALRLDPDTLRIVLGVSALGLILRLIYLAQLHGSGLWDFLRMDPLYYYDWAVRISRGELVGGATYEMTPLYAYILGGLFRLFGHDLLLPRILQALIGAATCGLVAFVGSRIFGRAEGIIAGLALALYGPALFHESQIMKTVLTTGLSTATAAILYFSQGRIPRLLLTGGLMLGITALAQENISVTVPFLLVWIGWRAPRGRKLIGGVSLLAGFACAVAPATIRNYAVSGDFVLITTGGGEVFYTGTHELASGKYTPPGFVRPDPFFEHEDFRAEAARRLGHPVTRKESDAFWWREGLRWIAENPSRYALLLWDKLMTYFNDYERPDNFSYYNFREFVPLLRAPLVRFGWAAPLALLGLVLSARRWSELLPLHLTIGAYVLSGLIFFTQSRYRMPMIPLFLVFAAHAAARLTRALRQRQGSQLLWCAPALGLLAVTINLDPNNSFGSEAQNHGILGEMHLHAQRPQEAAAHFTEALRMYGELPEEASDPQFRRVIASCHWGMVLALDGEAAAATGRKDGAALERHLRAAGESPDPDLRRDALDRLGALLLAGGDPAGAAEAYRGAVEADPEDFSRKLRLAQALHRSGKPLEALAAVDEALKEAGDIEPVLLGDAHYGRALVYRDLGDTAAMRHHLRECLRLNPAHPRAEWMKQILAEPS